MGLALLLEMLPRRRRLARSVHAKKVIRFGRYFINWLLVRSYCKHTLVLARRHERISLSLATAEVIALDESVSSGGSAFILHSYSFSRTNLRVESWAPLVDRDNSWFLRFQFPNASVWSSSHRYIFCVPTYSPYRYLYPRILRGSFHFRRHSKNQAHERTSS